MSGCRDSICVGAAGLYRDFWLWKTMLVGFVGLYHRGRHEQKNGQTQNEHTQSHNERTTH
eukprot:11170354-Lingulodinium_polyedra.AAC.1